MLTRKTIVLAKLESTYGIDPAPVPSADTILVQDLELRPSGDAVERNCLKGSLSPLQFRRGSKSVELSFKTEMKGTGNKGVIPAWGWEGVLFRACGMSETIEPETSIVYAPVSNLFDSCTFYVYRDRIFHVITGCRGTLSLIIEAGKMALAEWKFKGLYLSPVDATPAPQAFSRIHPPVAVQTSFTIGGYSPVVQKLELALNNTVVERRSLTAQNGIAGFEITGRAPNGSFDPEAAPESSHPFWSNWENAPAMALSLAVGTAPGNRFLIEAPALQYREMGYSDKEGRSVYQVPFSLAMDDGDDELTVTFE